MVALADVYWVPCYPTNSLCCSLELLVIAMNTNENGGSVSLILSALWDWLIMSFIVDCDCDCLVISILNGLVDHSSLLSAG